MNECCVFVILTVKKGWNNGIFCAKWGYFFRLHLNNKKKSLIKKENKTFLWLKYTNSNLWKWLISGNYSVVERNIFPFHSIGFCNLVCNDDYGDA